VGGTGLIVDSNKRVGIGTTGPGAKLHSLATTEQLRLGYDASNYLSTTIGSTGGVTFNAVGSGQSFTFSDPVNITGALTITGNLLPSADDTYTLGSTSYRWSAFVRPGSLLILAICVPASMLIKDDFPTFDLPIKAYSGNTGFGHLLMSVLLITNFAELIFMERIKKP